MDWYEPHVFSDSVRKIRKFLIEVASIRAQVELYGLSIARRIDGFDEAIAAMDEFPEKFSSLKRKVSLLDKELFSQLEFVEKEARLGEQLSLINLKIQMEAKRKGVIFRSQFAESMLILPRLFFRIKQSDMFGSESISIEKIIVNCDKLISTLKVVEEILRYREEVDDELFKPSNVKESHVVELIDQAISQIESADSLSHDAKEKLIGYLKDAKTEAASSSPKWNKIVGSLVIVAAITSGLADAPAAAKTVQSAIEYILGSAVTKPLHLYLPPPPPIRAEEPDLGGSVVA